MRTRARLLMIVLTAAAAKAAALPVVMHAALTNAQLQERIVMVVIHAPAHLVSMAATMSHVHTVRGVAPELEVVWHIATAIDAVMAHAIVARLILHVAQIVVLLMVVILVILVGRE